MNFEKWYFDFQGEESFGYYYVGLLRVAGICLTFVEIHQSGPKPFQFSATKMGRGCSSTFRSLCVSGASIKLKHNITRLGMQHGKVKLQIRWKQLAPSLPQAKRPLYVNRDGGCVWKVWAPYAAVNIEMQTVEDKCYKTEGKGYIDYVRLSIPFWKLPFRKLQWGRLFSENGDWIILFELLTVGGRQVYVGDKKGWHSCNGYADNIENTKTGYDREVDWEIGDKPIILSRIGELKQGLILGSDRLKWMPNRLKNWISSQGYEIKYLAEAMYDNKLFTGIMEEVLWDEI